MHIAIANTAQDISACYPVLKELRPQLNEETFVANIDHLRSEYGYQLISLRDQDVRAVAGIRIAHWLHTGKYLEIEDLITADAHRSKGYGKALFTWIVEYAKQQGCRQLRLVSGVKREAAHRFYLRQGMQFEAKYFSFDLT